MQRKKSVQLEYYELLERRRRLDNDEKSWYQSLKRGYEGECLFDDYVDEVLGALVLGYLSDLTLKHNRVTQIDSLLVTDEVIFQFEIKNYAMDLTWTHQQWQFGNGHSLNDDPVVQLQRSSSILRNILGELGFESPPIVPILVFINPDSFVDLKDDCSVKVLRSFELRRFLEELRSCYSSLSRAGSERVNQVCQHILHYQCEPAFSNFGHSVRDLENRAPIPTGIICPVCGNRELEYGGRTITCNCGHSESKNHALKRTIKEAEILEPNFELTYKAINTFIQESLSKSSITRVLRELRRNKGDEGHSKM